jgi:hypothetical protein
LTGAGGVGFCVGKFEESWQSCALHARLGSQAKTLTGVMATGAAGATALFTGALTVATVGGGFDTAVTGFCGGNVLVAGLAEGGSSSSSSSLLSELLSLPLLLLYAPPEAGSAAIIEGVASRGCEWREPHDIHACYTHRLALWRPLRSWPSFAQWLSSRGNKKHDTVNKMCPYELFEPSLRTWHALALPVVVNRSAPRPKVFIGRLLIHRPLFS